MRTLWIRRDRRWLSVLPEIVKNYNKTKHSSLCGRKYAPIEVSHSNTAEIYKYQTQRLRPQHEKEEPDLKVGDIVLISRNDPSKFDKGYHI